MITNAICEYLDTNHSDLTYKNNLFSQIGINDNYIVIKQTTNNLIDVNLSCLRESNIQVLSNGFTPEEAYKLVYESVVLIENMAGNSYTFNFVKINNSEIFRILSVIVLNYPIEISYNNNRCFTANLNIKYTYSYT